MASRINFEIRAFLTEHFDKEYKAFFSKLVPTLDPQSIVGVRTPALRSFAKQLIKHQEIDYLGEHSKNHFVC